MLAAVVPAAADAVAVAAATNEGAGVDAEEGEGEDLWLTNLTMQGKPYFYNKRTRETRWTLPEGATTISS